MDVSQAVAALKQKWREFYASFTSPPACVLCADTHVVWNGPRDRRASVLVDRLVVYVVDVICRRVRCQECRHSWTLRPPGLSPRRHFQLDVVAQATSRYLFEAEATQKHVAAEHKCDPRTLGRWLDWVPALVDPAVLQRLLAETAHGLVVPAVRAVAGLALKALGATHRALLERTAAVLCLFEALGMARGLEPPGLRGVVEAVVRDRDRITTYARPALSIPDFAS